MLRCVHSTVGEWVTSGRLIESPESDTRGLVSSPARSLTPSSNDGNPEENCGHMDTVLNFLPCAVGILIAVQVRMGITQDRTLAARDSTEVVRGFLIVGVHIN